MTDSEDEADGIRAGLWSAFPVARGPRPIVFAEHRVHLGERGFVDGASKLAYLDGAIESGLELPAGVLDMLIDGRKSRDRHVPLRVTSIVSTQAPFVTDRGPQIFPAYQLEIAGLNQPCTVLDPDIEVWWLKGNQWDLAARARHATIEPDGLTTPRTRDRASARPGHRSAGGRGGSFALVRVDACHVRELVGDILSHDQGWKVMGHVAGPGIDRLSAS